jgi:hypothetical protein
MNTNTKQPDPGRGLDELVAVAIGWKRVTRDKWRPPGMETVGKDAKGRRVKPHTRVHRAVLLPQFSTDPCGLDWLLEFLHRHPKVDQVNILAMRHVTSIAAGPYVRAGYSIQHALCLLALDIARQPQETVQ